MRPSEGPASSAATPDRGASTLVAFAEGARDILPAVTVAVPIGLLLGALCRSKGIQAAEAGWMSLLVNAGASQFAAVQLWGSDGPRLGPILLSTLLINVRHALMSLTLVPKFARAGMTRLRMCVALAFLTDPTWGFAEQRGRAGRPITWSYWMGLALVFAAAWTGATMAGAWLGAYLGDPRQVGADFALAALFIGMTARFWTGWRRTGFAIAASGLSSAVVFHTLGAPWHVMAGAAAGIAVAYFVAPPQAAQEPQST
ncbi:AzlC family ABC transporter permease [Variovorax atrisoli]|jgi:predicted branched-subunit amino acid permease|uniref:AzlC family ABC transporter permease n=1 Tax=Variovorax atrisoli TaxID=3394203 RepID=UPI0040401640